MEKAERERLKKEKEEEKETEKRRKEEEKRKKEEEREAEKKKREEEREAEKKRREEEKKRKEEEKEAEKKKKEEEKRRKEEEKEAEKKKKEEEERKKKERVSQGKKFCFVLPTYLHVLTILSFSSSVFTNFFTQKKTTPAKGDQSQAADTSITLAFPPFRVKENMRLAPTVRSHFDSVRRVMLDHTLEFSDQPPEVSCQQFKGQARKSGPTWPLNKDSDVEIIGKRN